MKKIIEIKTDKLFTDITEKVSEYSKTWGKSGLVNIYSKHTTFCIWCSEDEILHKADVRFFWIKLHHVTRTQRVNTTILNTCTI